jgi:Protein of unknown function (DUF3309)
VVRTSHALVLDALHVITAALTRKTHRIFHNNACGTFEVPTGFLGEGRANCRPGCLGGGGVMSIGTIILIILVIALLGGFSGIGGGPFYGTGYYGGGGLGLIIVILLILVLLGRL